MAAYETERVASVHHWNDTLFSFTTTRRPALRFESGQFLMIGQQVEGRPLLRAYSVASAAYDEHLEFLSIKVADGPLTSRLQHLRPGDELLVGSKPTGTLLLSDLLPGQRLFLFATGTGLAPFLSVVRDPQAYERFEQVMLVHGVRRVSDLAYRELLERELGDHPLVGEAAARKFLYYPTVTRETFRHQGRITAAVETGSAWKALGIAPLNRIHDRAMICGGPAILRGMRHALDKLGFAMSPGIGEPGEYLIERAFVEK